jgi:hypothetical protein
VSESDEPERKSTYIPDGDFEAFKWEKGQWVHVPMIDFAYKLNDGSFPTEATILDNAGNANEQSLEEASRRNMGEKPAAPPKKNTPPKKKTN